MTFALIKLSYNKIGENSVEGGICGAGFFFDNKTFVTAHHIFNTKKNVPNIGYKNCQYWLASRQGEIMEIRDAKIEDYSHIDTTVIRFPSSVTDRIVSIDTNLPKVGDKIYNQGFIPNMPQINAGWNADRLVIKSVNLTGSISDAKGTVRETNKAKINSNDVNVADKILIITSYPGSVGMSGGPMLNCNDNVVGLMSIGLPADVPKKDFLGAIWIDEIIKTI